MKSPIHKNTTNKAYIAFLFPLLLAYQSCKKSEKGRETIQSEKIEMKLMLSQDVSQKLKNVPGEKSGIITARLITGRLITSRAPFFPKSITEITFPVKLSEENGVFFVSFELPPSEGEWELSITFYITQNNKKVTVFHSKTIRVSAKPGDKIEKRIEVEEVDDDGDKFSNLQELIDGTDPQDYTSCISTAVFYKDADGDGYTDGTTRVACVTVQIEGFGMNLKSGDCDDNNASAYPSAPLVCGNSTDEDCDRNVESWAYTDSDGDRYAPDSTSSCVNTVSFPGQITAGSELGTNDCDDSNTSIHPGVSEICDGIDNDCDGSTDEGVLSTFYRDADGDGYGSPSSTTQACSAPDGYVSNSSDCDDTNSGINPSASEICDGIDNDCDGSTDEGLPLYTYYQDADGDGYGGSITTTSCSSTPPSGYVSNSSDCDDNNPSANPGMPEILDTVSDNNCNGVTQYVELAPSSLTYFFVSKDTVGLRWQDNSPNEEEFVVEVATDDSFSSIITSASFPQNTTEGYVGGLTENAQYWLRVYARNATAQTGYSNVVLAKTSSIYFENAAVIAAGGNHTCAIKTNGDLYCWGDNGYGQLGDGTNWDKNTPAFITSSVSSVALGYGHTCAIKTNGDLYCWGWNSEGQLGIGSFGGSISTPTFIMSSVTSVALGYYHTCAIKTNGDLLCWGDNSHGQLGDGATRSKSTPTRVLAGSGSGSSAPWFYFKEFGKPAESISSDEPYGCSSYSLIYAPLLVLSLMLIKKRKLKSKIAQKQ